MLSRPRGGVFDDRAGERGFAAVDAESRPGLREVLRDVLAGSEARTVIVSHDPADIEDLAGTVVRL